MDIKNFIFPNHENKKEDILFNPVLTLERAFEERKIAKSRLPIENRMCKSLPIDDSVHSEDLRLKNT